MATMVGVFALFLLLSVGLGLLLYALVRRERRGEEMDRESAERAARRDTGSDGSRRK